MTAEFPFDEVTLVHKVAGKMFALTNFESFETISLKCDPDEALALREMYPESVTAGYHLSKRHWNTLKMDGSLKDKDVRRWISDSWHLVVKGMSKKLQKELLSEKE